MNPTFCQQRKRKTSACVSVNFSQTCRPFHCSTSLPMSLSCMRLQVSVTFSRRFSNILAEENSEYVWRRWEADVERLFFLTKKTNKKNKQQHLCCAVCLHYFSQNAALEGSVHWPWLSDLYWKVKGGVIYKVTL